MPIRQYDDDLYPPPVPRKIADIGANSALQPSAIAPPSIFGRATPPATQSTSITTDPIARLAGQIPAVQSRVAPAALPGDPRSLEARVAQDGLTLGLLGPLADRTSTTPQRATIASIATTPPGTRAFGAPTTPSAGPAAAPDPNAPIGQDPNSPMLLNRQLAGPTNAAGTDLVARGNAGIRSLAANPNTFNDANTAAGTGISATSSNGKLTINGVAATQPQNFTQGYDLAENNRRARAALDAGYESDRKAQIADLTDQLKNSNAPPGSARAAALTGQIAALSGIQQASEAGGARAGLEKAQGGLATAQAQQIGQQTRLSAQQAKDVSDLHARFTAESDPTKQKILGDKILTLMGKDPREGAFQVVPYQVPVDPANPLGGTKNVAALVNVRAGSAQSIEDAITNGLGAKAPPPGPPGFKFVGLKGGRFVYEGPDGKRLIASDDT